MLIVAWGWSGKIITVICGDTIVVLTEDNR